MVLADSERLPSQTSVKIVVSRPQRRFETAVRK